MDLPVNIYFTNLAIEVSDHVGIVFCLFELWWPLPGVVTNTEVGRVDPSGAKRKKNEALKVLSL